MLLIDDLLAAPVRGLMFVLREIADAADAEREAEQRTVMSELAALHRRLDAGAIGEADFDRSEQDLLQRLDRLHGAEEPDVGSD